MNGLSVVEYRYLGDRLTSAEWRGRACTAVRRPDGKCIVSGSRMLVDFDGVRVVVLRQRLRRVDR